MFQAMSGALKRRIKQTTDFDSPAVEAMLNLLVAADFVRKQLDCLCGKYNLTNGQYNVLRILRGVYPEGHPRCEIAARMLERSPDVTRLVDRLEAGGLAARDRASEDRRLAVTRITEKGLRLLEEMQAEADSTDAFLADRISEKDCLALSRICEKIYSEDD